MSSAAIQITYRDGRTEVRPLQEGAYQVGRESGDIILGDPDVSARHAQLEVGGGRVTVTDLGSTNGTFDAEGRRISAAQELQAHQTITLGRTKIAVVPLQPTRGGTNVMPAVEAAPVAAPQPEPLAAPAAPPGPATTPQPKRASEGGVMAVQRGVVTRVERWTTTSTHTTQGHSHTDAQGFTHHTPGRSSTTTYVHQKVWVRDERGNDTGWHFVDSGASALPGHNVAVVYDRATGDALRFVNVSTGLFWRIEIESPGLVSQVLTHGLWANIMAALTSLPLVNFFYACVRLRDCFGKQGRRYFSLPMAALTLAVAGVVFASYSWLVPLLDAGVRNGTQTVTIPAEIDSYGTTALAHIVTSKPAEWAAAAFGVQPREWAEATNKHRQMLRDSAWLSRDALNAKYGFRSQQKTGQAYLTWGMALTVLGSFFVLLVNLPLRQLMVWAKCRLGEKLDRLARAEMS